MKALSLLVLLLGWGFHVQAQDGSQQIQQSPPPFHRLMQIYDQSRLPATAEMKGWFSGRCYRPQTPSTPFGVILVARVSSSEDSSGGPLFPPREVHEYNIFGQGREGAEAPGDYWDQMTPAKADFVENLLRQGAIHPSQRQNEALIAFVPEGNLVLSTRLYPTDVGVDPADLPGYFITRVHVWRDYPPYRAGQIFASCYFFKKVR